MHRTARASALLAGIALAVVALAGCASGDGGAEAAPVKASEVAVVDNRFDPAAVEVPAGTRITWRFDDGPVPHDVTGEGWSSGKPQTSGTFARTFDAAGTYGYRCTLHSGMKGRVVVTAAR
jgi:plastocyanin